MHEIWYYEKNYRKTTLSSHNTGKQKNDYNVKLIISGCIAWQ